MDQKHDHRKLSVIMWRGDGVLILKQTTERVHALSVVVLLCETIAAYYLGAPAGAGAGAGAAPSST